VSRFVKECRREWKRLRVPDSVANEMAADLTADLHEAEAEGASIEDVLGSSAFDPRSFARSWAAERGVSQPPTGSAASSKQRSLLAALAAIVAIVVALVGVLMVIAPKPRIRVGSPGHGLPVVPHHSFPGPPPGFAGHASAVASHIHTLGILVLIAGVVAMIATSVWIWRTRGASSSGWNAASAA
jgi:hypothetical protein